MRTYFIELRLDTRKDPELEQTLEEVIARLARTLVAQATMVNTSRIMPEVGCFWQDDFLGRAKHQIDHRTVGLGDEDA